MSRTRLVLWLCFIVTVLAGVTGLPPKVESNLLALLPENDPIVQAIQELAEDETGVHLLSITLQSDDKDALKEVTAELTEAFVEMEEVESAIDSLDEELSQQIGLLQFSPTELEELNRRLEGTLALGSAGRNPMIMQRIMDMGPLTERISKANSSSVLGGAGDQSKILIQPTGPPNEPEFLLPFYAKVEQIIEEANLEARGVEIVWIGGPYRHTAEDVRGIQQDLLWTSGVSLMLVLMVIIVSFRTARSLLVVFPPLIMANILNLALVSVFVGSLNTYTSFSTAILLGLGIDFAIHLMGRYREYRLEGMEVEDAVATAWSHVGPPSLTAALTSAAGFLALAAAQFKGFSQLGILLASGLMITLGCMLVLLPILLRRFDADPPPARIGSSKEIVSTSSYRYSPIGLATVLLFTVAVGVVAIPQLEFEYDVSQLRRDGEGYDELTEQQRKIVEQSYSPIVISADSVEDLRSDKARIAEAVEEGRMPHATGTVSLDDILPPDQAERNLEIERLVELTSHPNFRYLPPSMAGQLIGLRGLEVKELTRDDLPQVLLLMLGGSEEGLYRQLLMPKGNLWDVREAGALASELEGVLPGRKVAGESLGIARMFDIILTDVPVVGGLALIMVLLLTILDLRKMHWALGAVITLLTGMVWATAAMSIFRIKITMINLTGFPILLGIGIDVVIHLLHRLREEGPGGVRRALRTTGVAASISTLTTICSFLALTVAGNRGVRSLGLVIVVGLTIVFVMSALLLPLMWSAGWRVTGRAPSEQES